MKRFTVLSCAALAACTASTQSTPIEVPGLPAAGAPAVMFAPGVVSTNDVFASTFTPDGRTVVITKFSPPKPMTLLSSTFADGRWSTPTPLPFSGTFRDLDPAFSPDGNRLYFSSARPSGPSLADTTTGVDTWYVDRVGSGWGTPMRYGAPINSDDTDMYPSVTRRGVLYFDSFRSRPSRRFVYRAEPGADGTLNAPQLFDFAINTDSGASNLFVDADERFVIFGAVRPGGAGSMDLYLSWKTATGWTTPRNLGAQVNTAAVEFCPFVSRDGRYLYFTRVVTLPDQRQERNIFVVRFDDLLERLKK